MRATRTAGMLLLLLCCMGSVLAQQPFTYQGMLKKSGVPANGNYDFQFSLWTANSGGSQVGSTITRIGVSVVNGLFSTELDFGSVWDGNDRYLQIAVRSSGSGSYTTLSPRVKVNRVPYASRADAALPVGAAGGDLSGIYPNPTVAKLQGRAVSSTAPSAGQVLKWNGTAWSPDTDLRDAFWQASGSNIFYNAGNVGIGTSSPVSGALHVETSATNAAIYGRQTGGSRFLRAIYGLSEGPSGRGVQGVAIDVNGIGVLGAAEATSGNPAGVYGVSVSPNGIGVFGRVSPDLDLIPSVNSAGVVGDHLYTTGVSYGGLFRVRSGDGHGVRAFNEHADRQTEARLATYSDNLLTGETNLSAGGAGFGLIGLHGRSTPGDGSGVSGESENWKGVGGWTRNGYGVAGHQLGTSNAGVGVLGYAEGSTGVGVVAQNQQNGPALEIRGQIVVPNAHSATDTPVFKHTATGLNTSGHITTIDHPMCNGDPNAMLIVTHDWGTSGPYVTKPFGVWYNGSRWTIFIEDGSAMPLGAMFNVLVIKTSRGGGGFLNINEPPLTPTTVRSDER